MNCTRSGLGSQGRLPEDGAWATGFSMVQLAVTGKILVPPAEVLDPSNMERVGSLLSGPSIRRNAHGAARFPTSSHVAPGEEKAPADSSDFVSSPEAHHQETP